MKDQSVTSSLFSPVSQWMRNGMGLIVLVCMLVGCSASTPDGYQPLPRPSTLQTFSLYNQLGETITEKSFSDKWSLVFFGYTYCPDVCPTTLGEVNKVASRVKDERLQVVLVSVDPERDNPEQLNNYIQYFNPKFQAWSGDVNMLENLAAQMHIFFEKNGEGESYLMDHSSQLVLVNPDGQYVGFFPPPHKPDVIANALKALM